MRRFLTAVALFFLFIPSVFAMTAQKERQIVDNVLAVTGQVPLVLPDTLRVHRLCGTASLLEAKLQFNELSPRAQAALRPFLFTRPVLQKSYDPPSGRFRIHYDTSGTGAVRNAGVDANLNGVPDWVDTLGFILDSIWNKEVVQLGFRPPVADGFYPAGEDNRFDVYLDELGGAFLGYTAPDSVGGVLGNRATAFMVLDNDYAGIPGYTDPDGPRRAIRVTAAHEFFHAIQFAYTAYGAEAVGGNVKPYWYEASAVWMEDQMYNEINDYIQYLPFWFDAPQLSFRTFSDDFGNDPYRAYRPYALGIYGHYLSTRFPNPSYGYSVVRRIWERMATVTGFNLFSAIDYALGTEGSNFLASLREFYRWNYFVGGANVPVNAPDTLYGSEAATWPNFETYGRVAFTSAYPTRSQDFPCTGCSESRLAFFHSTPCTRDLGPPCLIDCSPTVYVPFTTGGLCVEDIEDLGAGYLNFQNPGSGSFADFALFSDTSRLAPWVAGVAGYYQAGRNYTFISQQPTDGSGRISEMFFPDFGNYSEIVVTVMNSNLLPSGAARDSSTFAYAANVDSSAAPGVSSIRDGRPNPFRPGIDPYVKFPVVLDSLSGSWDITLFVFTPAGEVVYRKDYELNGGFTYNQTVIWDGKNGTESGDRPVASGVYFCRIIMKEKGTSRKLEKLSKIALIRH